METICYGSMQIMERFESEGILQAHAPEAFVHEAGIGVGRGHAQAQEVVVGRADGFFAGYAVVGQTSRAAQGLPANEVASVSNDLFFTRSG